MDAIVRDCLARPIPAPMVFGVQEAQETIVGQRIWNKGFNDAFNARKEDGIQRDWPWTKVYDNGYRSGRLRRALSID